MSRKGNFLYGLLLLGCLAGYGWVFLSTALPQDESTVCLFKNATGVPCPSCGSTRALISLANGDLAQAIQWNPIGLIIALVLIVAPCWIAYDLTTKQRTLLTAFERVEHLLRKKWIAMPAILAIVINWMWNINKGL